MKARRVMPGLVQPICGSLLAVLLASSAQAAVVVEIVSLDQPGEGLNDAKPFAPEGGNAAPTLGEARRQAVAFAAAQWAETLESVVPIRIGVSFDPMGGTANQATLGTGGPAAVYRDFVGAPRASTYYPSALADKHAGQDLGGDGSLDILIRLNSDVDGPVVLGARRFDYGFDTVSRGGNASLVKTALHELAHGLGFVDLLDRASGAKFLGHDDAYTLHLEFHGALPASLSAMSDSQRRTAFTAGADLHWTGAAGVAAGVVLTAGRGAEGHLEMYAPSPLSSSSLTHFTIAASPDQIMEPFHVDTADPLEGLALARAVLADVGWGPLPGCSTATTPGPVTLLADDFSDGNFTGWTIVDRGITAGPSAWSVVSGALRQSADISNDPLGRGTMAIWEAGSAWTNYRASLQLWSSDDDEIGVLLRYRDPNNFYRFDMKRQGTLRRLVRVVNGTLTVLASEAVAYRSNDTYLLEASLSGPRLEIALDGKRIFAVNDSTLASGTVGLSSYANAGSFFDRIEVELDPPLEPATYLLDDFTDGNFAGFTVVDVGTVSKPSTWSATSKALVQSRDINGDPQSLRRGTLAWYAEGLGLSDYRLRAEIWATDDDSYGLLFRYRDPLNFYRFDWDRQGNQRRLEKVVGGVLTQLVVQPVPYDLQDHYFVEVTAIGDELAVAIDGETVISATDATLPTGSFGFASFAQAGCSFDEIRLLAPSPEAEPPFFTDDWSDGNFADWQVEDVGTAGGPSAWSIVSGALRQQSDLGGDLLSRGTWVWYPPGITWRNVRLRATLWSADDDEIGLMFRYQDADNFYRFDWDKQGAERRLVKVVAGVMTVLASDTRPYLTNERAFLEITTRGSQLAVRVNGSLIFSVVDSDLAAGTLALSSYENAGSYSDDISVTRLPASVEP